MRTVCTLTTSTAVYYYTWDRTKQEFTRHTIAAPGEGIALNRQFAVVDLNKDGRPDLVAPSTEGLWVSSVKATSRRRLRFEI